MIGWYVRQPSSAEPENESSKPDKISGVLARAEAADLRPRRVDKAEIGADIRENDRSLERSHCRWRDVALVTGS